jgi:hypothetical protein
MLICWQYRAFPTIFSYVSRKVCADKGKQKCKQALKKGTVYNSTANPRYTTGMITSSKTVMLDKCCFHL